MSFYERRHETPLTWRLFLLRLASHFAVASALVGCSLLAGMWGYNHYESLQWLDAFLNTSMLLGGMGPVDPPKTDAGKLFAGIYALYAGLVFVAVAGLLLAPVIHRILHRFHWKEESST